MDRLYDLFDAFMSSGHAVTAWGAVAIVGVVSVFVVPAIRRFRRRAGVKAFAAQHQMRFVGLLPSDKRGPYTQFAQVRMAVLLDHVVEGSWDGFDVAVFDYPPTRGTRWTAVILALPVSVPPLRIGAGPRPTARWRTLDFSGDGWQEVTPAQHPLAATRRLRAQLPGEAVAALGPQASSLIAASTDLGIETNFSYMLCGPERRAAAGELEDLVRRAAQLAQAFAEDARFRAS